MESSDELEDLVVLLDTDKDKCSDEEYEILEDLITIEDEGIMDISYKLRQRDFDEYVSSFKKDTTILPESFCRIKQNIKLLNRCRALTIQIVDCKKFKIFYNNKLALNLKTRETYDDRFKEILSDKDNDISDDDTIEIDVDITDDAEMEDLIKFDIDQQNADISDFQNIHGKTDDMTQSITCEKTVYFHGKLKLGEANIANTINNDSNMKKMKHKSGNNNLKVCRNVNCMSISMQHDSSMCNPHKTIPHYHSKKNKNIEFVTSNVTDLPKSIDAIYKINQTADENLRSVGIIGPNKSLFAHSQEVANKFNLIDYGKTCIRKESKSKNSHNIAKLNKKKKKKNQPLEKPKYLPNKSSKNINKHTKSIQLNIEMQKKIRDMLVTVEKLKNNYSKKSSRKSLYSSDEVVGGQYNVCQTQVNNINVTTNYISKPDMVDGHVNNKFPITSVEKNNFGIDNRIPTAIFNNLHIHSQHNNNINEAFMLPPLHISCNNNLHCAMKNNNNCNYKFNENTEKDFISKTLSSVNFMKSHLQKLAKINENPKSVKIRPIHHYGLSNNITKQEIDKIFTFEKRHGNVMQNNIMRPAQNSNQNEANLQIIHKSTSYDSNLHKKSVTITQQPTILKIIQNGKVVSQKTAKTNGVPITKTSTNLEKKTIEGHGMASCFDNVKENQELQQSGFLFQTEAPQLIPTLLNRKIIEMRQEQRIPDKTIIEHSNHETTIKNETEPWRIPLLKKTQEEIIKTPIQCLKMGVDFHNISTKRDDKCEQDIQNIIKKSIKIEGLKTETRTTKEEFKESSPSLTKLYARNESPKNKLLSTYQSPVQCVQVETIQSSPTVRKPKIQEVSEIKVKQDGVGHIPLTPFIKLPESNSSRLPEENMSNISMKEGESEKTSNIDHTPVTKTEYSPPVLPIPTFKETFEILAKVNLISKYRYRRSRNELKYAMVDQNKILSKRSITKDLEEYLRTSKEHT